jgi:hypothetical protein
MTRARPPWILWIGLVVVGGLAGAALYMMLWGGFGATGGCAAGIGVSFVGELQGTDTQAESAAPGDVIEYTVELSIANAQCPIRDGTVTLQLPDGSPATAATDVTLDTGDSVTFENAASYTVDRADTGGPPGASGASPTAAGQVRAMAEVSATAYRDDGSADDVTAGTSFTTAVLE